MIEIWQRLELWSSISRLHGRHLEAAAETCTLTYPSLLPNLVITWKKVTSRERAGSFSYLICSLICMYFCPTAHTKNKEPRSNAALKIAVVLRIVSSTNQRTFRRPKGIHPSSKNVKREFHRLQENPDQYLLVSWKERIPLQI